MYTKYIQIFVAFLPSFQLHYIFSENLDYAVSRRFHSGFLVIAPKVWKNYRTFRKIIRTIYQTGEFQKLLDEFVYRNKK